MANQNLRFFHRCALAGLAVCLFGGQVQAEEEGADYGPLFDTKPLKAPVECQIKTGSGFVLDTDQPTVAQCASHEISVTGISKRRSRHADEDGQTTHVVVSLKGSQQKALQVVFRVDDFPAGFIDGVEFADLNSDGLDDFILNLSDHGNGLAAELGGKLYLLSAEQGYRYLGFKELMSGSRLVRRENATLLLLQRLAKDKNGSNSVRGNDGKSHTFFVFDLLQFDVAAPLGVSLNNQLDARFPFWTLFTEEPGHAETTQLSSARKKALWRDPLAGVVSGKLVAK